MFEIDEEQVEEGLCEERDEEASIGMGSLKEVPTGTTRDEMREDSR